MEAMPLISVVISLYNKEKYMENAIDSVLNQSYKNIEVFLINDGSADETDMICQKYIKRDNRITYIKQENKGLSATRNVGLNLAKGEYITFVDGDDEIAKDMYEVLMHNMINHRCDISMANCYRLTENGETRYINYDKETRIFEGTDILKDYFTEGHVKGSLNFGLFHREVIGEQRLIEDMILYEDIYFLYLCLKRCKKICCYDIPLYGYRICENSLSNHTTYSPNMINIYKYAHMIWEDTKKNYPAIKGAANYFFFNACIRTMRDLSISKEGLDRERDIINDIVQDMQGVYCKVKKSESLGRRVEYHLITNTKYGMYYFWKIIGWKGLYFRFKSRAVNKFRRVKFSLMD